MAVHIKYFRVLRHAIRVGQTLLSVLSRQEHVMATKVLRLFSISCLHEN